MLEFDKKLTDVSLRDLYAGIDYDVDLLEDRLQIAREICDNDFFQIYFDEVYSVHLTTKEELSENDNVCKYIERLADYILLSNEEKQERELLDYHFFSSREHLYKKLNQELNFSDLLTDNGDIDDIILYNIDTNDCCVVQDNNATVDDVDFNRRDELGKILREYRNYLLHLEDDNTISNQQKQKQKYLVVQDMITVKKYFVGATTVKNKLQSSPTHRDYVHNKIDFKMLVEGFSEDMGNGRSKRHKGLLFLDKNVLDYNSPLYFWLCELDSIIECCNLAPTECEILYKIRQGYKQTEIAEQMGVTQQYVSKAYKKAINKIIKQYERKEDVYE